MGWRKQDRQTQRLYDNVTKSLLQQTEAQDQATSSYPYEDIPLKEEHPIGSLLLLRGAGPAAAKGLEFIGEKMMPSAFLKGVGQTFPKIAKVTTAISPYADAGLLATWGAQGIQEAKKAAKSGDTAGVIAGTSMAALPLIGINPEIVQELKSSQKVNNIARALNKEIRTSDLTVPSSYFHNPNSAYRATTTREIADLSHTGTTRPSFKSKLADHDYSQGYQGWLKGDNYMEIVENSKNPFTKAKHSNLLGNEGVILETDGTGKLFRHGYHGSAGELEPFENIDTTPGELVTSGLAKGMYKKRNGGYGKAFTFKGLALGPEDPGISSDAISYFTRAGKGRWKYQGIVPKSKEITVKPTLKQTRVVSEGTYPLYTGPKHSVTEVVNPDGTVNPRVALRIEREVADNIPGAYRMESRLENPEWHVNDPNTWAHTRNVAQSAWTVPTPKGLTKQDQMVAALGHDFGKMVSGDGHAQSSAALIEQIFPDVTEQQLTAISEHMGTPKSILGKVTKQADILNGKPAITRFVGDNGKIRLRLPSHTVEKPRELVLDPQGNNKFRVHTRTWDGDHIPAEMSAEDKNTLFNALYEELPEGAEILFPESGPGNYATRGTVAGLQRLARDSRFKPTGNGVLQYVDKDGSIQMFEGTGFKKQQGGILKAQGGLGKIPILGKFLKDKAYTVITDPNVWWKAGADNTDIKNALFRKTPDSSADNNKYMFIYGADKLRDKTSDGEAYTWAKDIQENNYKNVESFEGVLNPYNEYLVNKRDEGLVRELAKRKYTTNNNINDEYTNPETGYIDPSTPYFDDAHVYRLVFHTKDGQPVISASDLYDFGKNYTEGFSELYEERGGQGNAEKRLESQRKWLNRVGKPYKLVQHNIPIRFVDNPQDDEINRVNNFSNVFDRMSDEDVAKALGNKLLEPAIIKAKK